MKAKLAKLLECDSNMAVKKYEYYTLEDGRTLFTLVDPRKGYNHEFELTPEEFEIVRKLFGLQGAEGFISHDNKTIHLPVPLGSTVFQFYTKCNDACTFQKEAFDKAFPKADQGRCSEYMPCHTRPGGVRTVTLSLSNLDWVLRDWGKKVFETESEATEAMHAVVELHKKQLVKLGLKV